jgi:hypothetical protein
VQHRVNVMDCLPYLLRVEQIELGRQRRCKLMAALTEQWGGHPPENSRGPRDQDAHAADVNDAAHGRVGRGSDSRCQHLYAGQVGGRHAQLSNRFSKTAAAPRARFLRPK